MRNINFGASHPRTSSPDQLLTSCVTADESPLQVPGFLLGRGGYQQGTTVAITQPNEDLYHREVSLHVPLHRQRMAGPGPPLTVTYPECARPGLVGAASGECVQPSLCPSNPSPWRRGVSRDGGSDFALQERSAGASATSSRAAQFNPPSFCQVKSSPVQKSGCMWMGVGRGRWRPVTALGKLAQSAHRCLSPSAVSPKVRRTPAFH